jgi:hypothetical protein
MDTSFHTSRTGQEGGLRNQTNVPDFTLTVAASGPFVALAPDNRRRSGDRSQRAHAVVAGLLLDFGPGRLVSSLIPPAIAALLAAIPQGSPTSPTWATGSSLIWSI